jgi:EmrB/QacA subfamily drug resistance transporter
MTERVRAHAQRLALRDDNRRWWTLVAMCFALFMIMLDNTVVNVALPAIQRDLHTSLSSLEWTINAYTLSFAVLLVTGGRLGDIFGRRRAFLAGVVVFALSSAAIGLAPTDGALIAGRAVQGIGAALMMPATLSIITHAFPPHERGKAIGTWAGVSALALAIGPVLGGALTESVGWRSIFFLNLPVAVGAVAMTLFAARESRDDTVQRRVDVPGIGAITIGLTALVLALVESNRWGWGSGRIVGLFVLAGLSLAAFVAIELRTRVPMVDFSFFRSRSFLGSNLVAFVVSFAMLAMFFFMALYMQNILGYSPLQAGLRFLPSTLCVMVVGPIAGRLTDRLGPRNLLVAGLVLVSGALLWQSRLGVHTGYTLLLPGFVGMGIGIALVMSPMSTAAMNAVAVTKAGVASGVLSMSRMVGGTFGVAAMGALVAGLGRSRLEALLPGVPAARREAMVAALGGGGGHARATGRVADAMREAYVYALSHGLRFAAGVTLVGAVAAVALVTSRPAGQAESPPDLVEAAVATPAAEEAEAALAAEAVGAPR